MKTPIALQADHSAPLRPSASQAISEANEGTAPSYGGDTYSQELHRVLEGMLGKNIHIALTATGTQANALALDALRYASAEPAATIITPTMSHIVVHEAGIIPKVTGMSIIRLPSSDGKFLPESLDQLLAKREDDTIFEQPTIVSITNPTEVGTVWQPEEIRHLAEYCHGKGLFLFIDGTRVWNAAASLGFQTATETIRTLYEHADSFTIGMIKNGSGLADIVCLCSEILSEKKWGRLIKQHGAELAKARFFSASPLQDITSETEPLFAAKHANQQAQLLANALRELGVELGWQTETNMVWPLVTESQRTAIASQITHYREDDWTGTDLEKDWSERILLRFVTSWATTDVEVEQAIEIFKTVFS